MMRARSPTASSTARSSAIFSSSVVVGDSPVVPDSTRPSQPASTRWVASRAAAVGVQRAVGLERRHHGGQHGAQPGASRRIRWCSRAPRLPARPHGSVAYRRSSSLRRQRTGRHLACRRPAWRSRSRRTPRGDVDELAQAFDRQPADLDVGVLAGPHRDEVPPGAVVAGHDDAGLGGVRQHCAGGLPRLLAPQQPRSGWSANFASSLASSSVYVARLASAAAVNISCSSGRPPCPAARPLASRARARTAATAANRRSAGDGSARGCTTARYR